jgi:hypothetical protein
MEYSDFRHPVVQHACAFEEIWLRTTVCACLIHPRARIERVL